MQAEKYLIGKKSSVILAIVFTAIITLPMIYRNVFELSKPDTINKIATNKYVPWVELFKFPNVQAQDLLKEKKKIDPRITRSKPTLAEHLKANENEIEETGFVKFIRNKTQFVLTKFLREGNQKVFIGKNGVYFYRPGLDSLSSYGTLRTEAKGVAYDPTLPKWRSPLPAILKFNRQLKGLERWKDLDVELIIVSLPIKPSLQSEDLGFARIDKNIKHIDSEKFYQQLEKHGIQIINLSNFLLSLKNKKRAKLFLDKDTHWTHETMRQCAKFIVQKIKQRPWFSEIAINNASNFSTKEITNFQANTHGDIAEMLNFKDSSLPYPTQSLTQIYFNGEPLTSKEDSEIVFLGDSFANIYAEKSMGYGEFSGLARHLSYELKAPLEFIAINGQGSTGVRKALAKQKASADKMRHKKAVIWAIAERDLFLPESVARENGVVWHDVEFQQGKYKPKITEINNESKAGKGIGIIGKVVSKAGILDPKKATYSDALVAIDYKFIKFNTKDSAKVSGDYKLIAEEGFFTAYHWAFEDKFLKPASKIQIGQKLQLNIKPWHVMTKLQSIQRFESDEYYPTYFADSFSIFNNNNNNNNNNNSKKEDRQVQQNDAQKNISFKRNHVIAGASCFVVFLLLCFVFTYSAYRSD